MASSLSNPSVEVDDTVISIKPNSLKYKRGWGNITQRSQSAGGNSIELIGSEDAETKKGMVSFTLLSTKENAELLDGWLENSRNANGVTVRFTDGDFTISYRGMKILEEPEVSVGADGEFEVMLEGQPALR